MKRVVLITGALVTLFMGSCSRTAYTVNGYDDERYQGQYYGNRPKDLEGYGTKPYIGGGYGWQRGD